MIGTSVLDDLLQRLKRLEQDIAEAKKANHAPVTAESLYEDLVRHAPIGISRATRDGQLLFVNQALARMLGYSSPENAVASAGTESAFYVNPAERRLNLNLLESTEALEGFNVQIRQAGGQVMWHRVFIRVVQTPPGPSCYETFYIDITDRKLANDSLYQSEKRFRMLVEQAGDSFLLHDTDGRIMDANRQACESLGYTREELLTKGIHDISTKMRKRQFWNPLTSGQFVTFESVQIRKDGSTFPVEVRLSRLDLGSRTLLLSLVRDITFRKEAENELKRNFEEIKALKNRLEQENVFLREEIEVRYRHEEIVGESKAIKKTLSKIEKVANEDTCVLILGETGTGKELIARAIHNMSDRRGHSMVKVNCAALPATLIESELFGREKGAFTGALTKQEGRFEAANHSTIFLDEIGDMPMELQTKLLRVLQDGTFERLGTSHPIKVDVRVLAATNQNLLQLIQDKRFRSDLYYRLNVFPIQVPSLRERLDDIPLLVWAFVKEFSATMGKPIKHIPKRDMDLLQSYTWPGNIRELRNAIERAMILVKDGVLRIDPLEPEVSLESKSLLLSDVEKRHIVEVLRATGWRISGDRGAAKALGLNPSTLRSRIKKLGIRQDHPSA